MSKREYRKGALPYAFVGIPLPILRHPEYIGLADSAKALMMDLCEQYSGGNNGRLTTSFVALERRGWHKNRLIRAKRQLLSASFCVLTRKGKAPQTAEWVGFTWWRLDYHRTMEIDPAKWPFLNFQTIDQARIDPNPGRDKLNPVVPKQHRYKSSGGAKTAPIESVVRAA